MNKEELGVYSIEDTKKKKSKFLLFIAIWLIIGIVAIAIVGFIGKQEKIEDPCYYFKDNETLQLKNFEGRDIKVYTSQSNASKFIIQDETNKEDIREVMLCQEKKK